MQLFVQPYILHSIVLFLCPNNISIIIAVIIMAHMLQKAAVEIRGENNRIKWKWRITNVFIKAESPVYVGVSAGWWWIGNRN